MHQDGRGTASLIKNGDEAEAQARRCLATDRCNTQRRLRPLEAAEAG